MVVATFRDDELAPTDPLRIALGELGTQRSTRRIRLAPLSAAAVGTLAADSGLDPADLFRLTGGNPFFVTEAVRAGTSGIPVSARDAVLARAARLGEAARGMLDTAALVFVDKWADAAEAAQRARALWHSAGDRRREGDALRRLSGAMCNLRRALDIAGPGRVGPRGRPAGGAAPVRGAGGGGRGRVGPAGRRQGRRKIGARAGKVGGRPGSRAGPPFVRSTADKPATEEGS
jgi:hypothetical protein